MQTYQQEQAFVYLSVQIQPPHASSPKILQEYVNLYVILPFSIILSILLGSVSLFALGDILQIIRLILVWLDVQAQPSILTLLAIREIELVWRFVRKLTTHKILADFAD